MEKKKSRKIVVGKGKRRFGWEVDLHPSSSPTSLLSTWSLFRYFLDCSCFLQLSFALWESVAMILLSTSPYFSIFSTLFELPALLLWKRLICRCKWISLLSEYDKRQMHSGSESKKERAACICCYRLFWFCRSTHHVQIISAIMKSWCQVIDFNSFRTLYSQQSIQTNHQQSSRIGTIAGLESIHQSNQPLLCINPKNSNLAFALLVW